jgi:hypothetical protein
MCLLGYDISSFTFIFDVKQLILTQVIFIFVNRWLDRRFKLLRDVNRRDDILVQPMVAFL